MTRNDWTRAEIAELFDLPFTELVFRAADVHRHHHAAGEVQLCTLLSIKTGGCPEDCGYCSQSAHADTGLKAEKLMDADAVIAAAREAKAHGSQRFCMGAAWREPKERDMPALCQMVGEVKAMGLETCMTLGMLTGDQARALKDAGLDYYNHNIDTSPEHYPNIVTTHTFQDRLNTIQAVQGAGMDVCCGGIIGLGETVDDRLKMLEVLTNFDPPPESVPINCLVPIDGTPLAGAKPVDTFELVRLIATTRIMLPKAKIRLSAGRSHLSREAQALCYFAGANSIFYGDKLLTTPNAGTNEDIQLLDQLGLRPQAPYSDLPRPESLTAAE